MFGILNFLLIGLDFESYFVKLMHPKWHFSSLRHTPCDIPNVLKIELIIELKKLLIHDSMVRPMVELMIKLVKP